MSYENHNFSREFDAKFRQFQLTQKMIEKSIKGFMKIEQSDNKSILKLRGDFDSNNVHMIKQAMVISKSLNNSFFELDMIEVKTITMQAMTMLIITLKKLKESGMSTAVTGLNKTSFNLAKELGMQFIAQMK